MNDVSKDNKHGTTGIRQNKTVMRPETALFVAASWSGLIEPKLRPFAATLTTTTEDDKCHDGLENEKSEKQPM